MSRETESISVRESKRFGKIINKIDEKIELIAKKKYKSEDDEIRKEQLKQWKEDAQKVRNIIQKDIYTG